MTYKDGDRVLVNDMPAKFHYRWKRKVVVSFDGQDYLQLVDVSMVQPAPPAVPHLVTLHCYDDARRWSTMVPRPSTVFPEVTVDLRVAKLAEAGVVVYKTLHGWTWANMHGDDTSGYSSIALIATDAAWEYAVGKGLVKNG